jgi:radical SAM protein with 4Fe4S-binding SPASM domain
LPTQEQAASTAKVISSMRGSDPWMCYFLDKRSNWHVVEHACDTARQRPELLDRCHVSQITNVMRADGTVYPCNLYARRRTAPLGNVLRDPLATIFERQHAFYQRTNPLEAELCAGCPQRELTACSTSCSGPSSLPRMTD